MNQIEKLNQINLNQLDQGDFFQALFQEVCQKQLLSPIIIEGIQLGLIELLGKEVERYTNGESSSVPVEKAQEILHSITYCLGLYLKTYSDSDEMLKILQTEKIATLFNRGMDAVQALKAKAEQLIYELQISKLKINNYAYQDSIASDNFFQSYDIEFGAFDIAADIDYPPCLPLNHLIGVEYIYEYLQRLTLENNFLKHFAEQKINMLLGFHKDAEHMLINIFELVLINVLGCKLLDLNIKELDIPAKDCRWLYERLIHLNKEEIMRKLEDAMDQVKVELSLDSDTTAYAKIIIPELEERIRHNLETDTLMEIFISFADNAEHEEVFIDGIPMDDESLRDLIDELGEYNLISDKMNRIRETVQSFADMTELLEECFYTNEYEEVFRLLNESERAVLISRILDEAGPEAFEDFEPDKEWQRILFQRYRE